MGKGIAKFTAGWVKLNATKPPPSDYAKQAKVLIDDYLDPKNYIDGDARQKVLSIVLGKTPLNQERIAMLPKTVLELVDQYVRKQGEEAGDVNL